eukprot:679902-Rhodomonas_salina.1
MNVDPSVLRAMNEINASRRQREAAVERAEAEKILAVKAAEAEAEAKELSGKGTARMRQVRQLCGSARLQTAHNAE